MGSRRDGVPVSWGRLCKRCEMAGEGNRETHRRALHRGKKISKAVWACLSRDEWVSLWQFQGGACAICLAPVQNRYDRDPSVRLLAGLDHRHGTERDLISAGVDPMTALRRSVRGFLCYFCNRNVVGVALKDSAAKAQRAADYLRDPPARRVLDLGPLPSVPDEAA